MLNKEILGEVSAYFWQRYEQMKEKDSDIEETRCRFMELLAENGIQEADMGELEDGMIDFTTPLIMLAYFMGIQDGVDMLETLRDRYFVEKILEMYETRKKSFSMMPTA